MTDAEDMPDFATWGALVAEMTDRLNAAEAKLAKIRAQAEAWINDAPDTHRDDDLGAHALSIAGHLIIELLDGS